jgi:AcrR family transcriptional regulator
VARRPRGQLRQDILNTVIDLLVQAGDVAAVSIDAVVDRVGCTPPALYYYFPTKNDLLWQACEAEFAKLAEHIEGQVADVDADSTLAALITRGQSVLHWAAEHPALYRILFMGTGRDGVIRGQTWDDPSLQAIVRNLDSAKSEGLVRPELDSQLVTLTLWGTVHGFASLTVSFPAIPVDVVGASMNAACAPILRSMLTPVGLQSLDALLVRYPGV